MYFKNLRDDHLFFIIYNYKISLFYFFLIAPLTADNLFYFAFAAMVAFHHPLNAEFDRRRYDNDFIAILVAAAFKKDGRLFNAVGCKLFFPPLFETLLHKRMDDIVDFF